jgi:RNAse (barnase) inhibitor barstar
MKEVILDGSRLADPYEVYDALAAAFRLPEYFGKNPDALWDALGDYAGEPVTIIWRGAARFAGHPHFTQILAVLERAAAKGMLTVELR